MTHNRDAAGEMAEATNELLDCIRDMRDLIGGYIYDEDGHDQTPSETDMLWLLKVELPEIIGRVMPMCPQSNPTDEIPF